MIMVATLATAGTGQDTKTIHNIGKDKDGDTWYLDTSLVFRLRPPADWVLLMPIYTTLNGRTLVFMFNVDCSDRTYQMVKAFSMNRAGETLWEKTERTPWSSFTGYSGRAGTLTCNNQRQFPMVDSPINE